MDLIRHDLGPLSISGARPPGRRARGPGLSGYTSRTPGHAYLFKQSRDLGSLHCFAQVMPRIELHLGRHLHPPSSIGLLVCLPIDTACIVGMQTVGFSEGREEAHRVRIRLNSESGSGSSIFSSDNHERRPEHAGRRRALLQVRRKPVWKDRMKVQQRDYTKLSVFLLDVNRTPGLDSRKRYKRVCARIWHEFKVTLLSGTNLFSVMRTS